MPIGMQVGQEQEAESVERFMETDKVFFCKFTKKIFRHHEQYYQHMLLLNSTVWCCSETDKQNITYIEALQSEKRARKAQRFSEWTKAPALLLAQAHQQTSSRLLLPEISLFIKDRFFQNEELEATKSNSNYVPCKIVQIIPPKESLADGVYYPNTLTYKVQSLSNTDTWITTISNMRRCRAAMNLKMFKTFLKKHTTIRDGNGIRVKPESYEKYVTSKNLTFSSVFVGHIPKWEPVNTIPKEAENYDANDSTELQNVKMEIESEEESTEECCEEGEEEDEENQVMDEEDEEVSTIEQKSDDLECVDQKVMPLFKPVSTLVDSKYFGELVMIHEFLHSFAPELADENPSNITFLEMSRALLVREVAGPLSDILQFLLTTIFTLQVEENCAYRVFYSKIIANGPLEEMAVETHSDVHKYYCMKMFELPVDAHTLSEVLRLHLLSSGASVKDISQYNISKYRNNYTSADDPGLFLRIQYPHILRSLKTYTIYQLPFEDVLKVVSCLIEQILTYETTFTCIENRQKRLIEVRDDLRLLGKNENERIKSLQDTENTMFTELQAEIEKCMDDANKMAELQSDFNKNIEQLEEQEVKLKSDFQHQRDEMNDELFDLLTLLGSDRAYRNYYVFKSMPGLFIEHPIHEQWKESCLENPPMKDEALSSLSKDTKDEIETCFFDGDLEEDKENINMSDSINRKNNKSKHSSNRASIAKKAKKAPPTATDFYMCSGEPKTCIVHNPRHPSRTHWSFINSIKEFDALLESLNTNGARENALAETLIIVRQQIVSHMDEYPTRILRVNPENREKSMQHMLAKTQKKYANSNFGHAENADINEVMKTTLTNKIIEFQKGITDDRLGRMTAVELKKWRENITSQHKIHMNDPESVIDVETGSDNESKLMHEDVRRLASALLQAERSIEPESLKEPFGIKNPTRNRAANEANMAEGKAKLQQWEVSLMDSTNYSQIFLHLHILSDTVKWNSTLVSCTVCQRIGHRHKLLICHECNTCKHTYCMNPPMSNVPELDWFCNRCKRILAVRKLKSKKSSKRYPIRVNDESSRSAEVEPQEIDRKRKATDQDFCTYNIKRRSRHIDEFPNSDLIVMLDFHEKIMKHKDAWPFIRPVHLLTEPGYYKINKKPMDFGTIKTKLNQFEYRTNEQVVKDIEVIFRNCKNYFGEESEIYKAGVSLEQFIFKKCQELGLEYTPSGMFAAEVKPTKKETNNNFVSGRLRSTEKSADFDSTLILDLLEHVGKDAKAWRFSYAISPFEDPDNYKKIKKPMDFSTIKSKLALSKYSSNEEVIQDIELIFKNCEMYYMKNSFNLKAAESVEKLVIKKCQELKLKYTRSKITEKRLGKDPFMKRIPMLALIEQIIETDVAQPVLRALSPSAVPDYYTIIEKPMDFVTIKSKLNGLKYLTDEDVCSDIRLVFNNFDACNFEDSELCKGREFLELWIVRRCTDMKLTYISTDLIAAQACRDTIGIEL